MVRNGCSEIISVHLPNGTANKCLPAVRISLMRLSIPYTVLLLCGYHSFPFRAWRMAFRDRTNEEQLNSTVFPCMWQICCMYPVPEHTIHLSPYRGQELCFPQCYQKSEFLFNFYLSALFRRIFTSPVSPSGDSKRQMMKKIVFTSTNPDIWKK